MIHDSATIANAAAAALLINGREGWAKIAEKMGAHSVMMISQDGTIYTSPGMSERIRWRHKLMPQRLMP